MFTELTSLINVYRTYLTKENRSLVELFQFSAVLKHTGKIGLLRG